MMGVMCSPSRMLQIDMFPALAGNDNYGFLLHDTESGETACIDTPELGPILEALERRGWELTAIWNTHHHYDHVGANLELVERFGCEVVGNADDAKRITGLTRGVRGGETFRFGAHDVHVIDTPGHTVGHICYHVPDAGAAFVGDTLFVMGCGRLFEGTPAQMHESLAKLMALPPDTKLYCAHEYTLSNAAFAVTVDGGNAEMLAAIEEAKARRERGEFTVPTTVARERATNPFVRAGSAAELGRIRALKDGFRG